MRRTRYGGYRGRRTGRDVLKYVILGLLVLIAVLAGILLLGREQPTAEEHPETEQQEQISEDEQTETQPEVEPEPVPEPEPEPEPFVMQAVGVDLAQVLDGSWERMMKEAGANTLILNMKPDDGTLNWDFGSSVEDSDINAKLWLMNSNAEYSVARISCFRDEALANTYEYCIRSNSGYRWKDFGGVHWVSPAHVEVQDRLIEQVVDLARLGFTEILLDNCGYPQNGSGEMGWIKRGEVYDLANLDAVIGDFLARLDEALEQEGWGPTISIRTNAVAVSDPAAARTGLTGAVLERYADRIWMSEIDTTLPLAEILTTVGVNNVEERLVTQTTTLVPENEWEQAVMPF